MKKTITEYFQKSFAIGVGLTAGIMATALMAATVSGVIHIFFPGQAVSSSQINENFASLKTAVESVDIPVGTILAWHKNLGGVPALSGNWVECDGSVINDSASDLHGQTLPDLNGAYVDASAKSHKGYFLRGHSISGLTETDAFQGHYHGVPPGTASYLVEAPGASNSLVGGGGTASNSSFVGDPSDDGINGSIRKDSETRPVNMSVVWIMKIK